VHGDLTLGNVLLSSSHRDARHWVCKVGDFGLCQILQCDLGEIQDSCYGTLTHAAPELVVDGLLTRAADVYSFAVIMLELVKGQRAWKGFSFMQILSAISAGEAGTQADRSLALHTARMTAGVRGACCATRDSLQRTAGCSS
jgi:serine/threonine protein kinase